DLYRKRDRDWVHLGADTAKVRLDHGDVGQPWVLERPRLCPVWIRHDAWGAGYPQHRDLRARDRARRARPQRGVRRGPLADAQPRHGRLSVEVGQGLLNLESWRH